MAVLKFHGTWNPGKPQLNKDYPPGTDLPLLGMGSLAQWKARKDMVRRYKDQCTPPAPSAPLSWFSGRVFGLFGRSGPRDRNLAHGAVWPNNDSTQDDVATRTWAPDPWECLGPWPHCLKSECASTCEERFPKFGDTTRHEERPMLSSSLRQPPPPPPPQKPPPPPRRQRGSRNSSNVHG